MEKEILIKAYEMAHQDLQVQYSNYRSLFAAFVTILVASIPLSLQPGFEKILLIIPPFSIIWLTLTAVTFRKAYIIKANLKFFEREINKRLKKENSGTRLFWFGLVVPERFGELEPTGSLNKFAVIFMTGFVLAINLISFWCGKEMIIKALNTKHLKTTLGLQTNSLIPNIAGYAYMIFFALALVALIISFWVAVRRNVLSLHIEEYRNKLIADEDR